MSNVEILLQEIKPQVDLMVENFITNWDVEIEHRAINSYDIKMYEIGLQIDMLKAFGRYVLETDVLTVNRVNKRRGLITINVTVTRNSIDNYFQTEVIVAGGYNIQCRHLRYIVDTNLRKLGTDTLSAKLIAQRKKLTLIQRVNQDKDIATRNYYHRINEVNTKLAWTDEEIIDNLSYNALFKTQYKDLNPGCVFVTEYKYTKEQYDAHVANELNKVIVAHRERYNVRSADAITKSYEKEIAKLDKKLDK